MIEAKERAKIKFPNGEILQVTSEVNGVPHFIVKGRTPNAKGKFLFYLYKYGKDGKLVKVVKSGAESPDEFDKLLFKTK